MASKHWERLQKDIKPENGAYARKSLDVVDAIHIALDKAGITQADLARQLGKSPSEINKWLSPGHNMTLKTIAKLEAVLQVDLLSTPLRFRAKTEVHIPSPDLERQRYRALREQARSTLSSTEESPLSRPVIKAPFLTDDHPTRYNFNVNELLKSSIETTIDNVETPALAGNPSYAMAA